MNSDYKVFKFKNNTLNELNDQISVEEPLEIIIKFKDKDKWIETVSYTHLTLPTNREV